MEQAKQFILDAQGLRTKKPCKSIISVVKRIHNIQIDTISVVARSHNLTTFNRFNKYQDGAIWNEQKRGKLFEYWSHGMCLMPMETYPFYAWKMSQYKKVKKSWMVNWGRQNTDTVEEVYNYVKKNGVTMSKSIGQKKRKTNGWWDWKAEKRALEYLHTTGRLMVAYRQGFQKCYDITERVLPAGQDTEPMAEAEIPTFMMETLLQSLGLASYHDMKWYFGPLSARTTWGSRRADYEEGFDDLIESGLVEKVSIEGQKEHYYTLKKDRNHMLQKEVKNIPQKPVKLLSPFDNVMRERHLPEKIWAFNYKLEAYTPVKKREYGYFVLPILDGCDFVGRTDAKAHRKEGMLELKTLYLETPFWKDERGAERLITGIREFADFHKCGGIEISSTVPKSAKSVLTKKLNQ